MANALDAFFQAANALPPPVPGDNLVQAQCVATLINIPTDQVILAQGPLQFTPTKSPAQPAFFSATAFAGPAGDPNNALSFQTRMTLTAPRPGHSAYSLTVQAPIFSPSLSLAPQATLLNGTYHIAASPSQSTFISLLLFAPIAIDL
jgi:hypothetical protein